MPVGEMLRRMDSRELTEWMAYYRLDPFGLERHDLQAGIVSSTIANAYRDAKKRKKPFQPQDFIPNFSKNGSGKPKMSWQEQLAMAEIFNAAFGGEDLR